MHRNRIHVRAAFAALALTALVAGRADAHFIWIHLLREEQPPRVEFLFGDGIYQDSDANLVRYVEGLEAQTADGTPFDVEVHNWGLDATLPAGTRLVGATKPMGVFTPPRGGENRLLRYYAKGAADLAAAGQVLGLHTEVVATTQGEELGLQVLFGGEPAAGAEVQVSVPGTSEKETLTADDEGRARIAHPGSGALEVRGRVIVPQEGEEDGKAYTTIQHYSTLVVASVRDDALASGASLDAYQRLERATGCQERFPADMRGLGGVLKVNVDGVTRRGEFDFQEGSLDLELEGADEALRKSVSSRVASMLRHRSPHDFASGDGQHVLTLGARDNHPLGRRVDLNDGSTSGYRVREDEILEVERHMGDSRFVLTVEENVETEAGRYLPKHFSLATFDTATGKVLRTEVFSDEYQDVDGVMLPRSRRITTFEDGQATTMHIEFRNLEVLRGA